MVEEYEGESDQQQAEGQLEPSDRESAAFRNLQSMDEYTLDHELRDILNEKLSHTQEYLTELQVNQHPDANAAAQIHEALHEMSHEGIKESVEKGNGENFVEFIRYIEGADQQLALEMRERNGFIRGENYVQPKPPQDFTTGVTFACCGRWPACTITLAIIGACSPSPTPTAETSAEAAPTPKVDAMQLPRNL